MRASLLVLLAACPPPGRNGPPPPPPPQPGAGCPSAQDIYFASYLTLAEPGKPGHVGWVLPLVDKPVDTVEGLLAYAPADAAAGLAVPTTKTLWLFAANTQPCKATFGAFYQTPISATAPNIAYGVELEGCPKPADEQESGAIILAQDAPPTDCRLETLQPLAERLTDSTDKKHWSRPTKATPLPPALTAILPPHECTAPTCEMLWEIGQVAVNNQPVVLAGTVNWLAIPPDAAPETQCDWKDETFSGFFTIGRDGKATKVTEGQEHPLSLTSVLVDRTGPRALVAQALGEYATYELSPDGAKLARHLVWLRDNAEAYELDDHLGPNCDED